MNAMNEIIIYRERKNIWIFWRMKTSNELNKKWKQSESEEKLVKMQFLNTLFFFDMTYLLYTYQRSECCLEILNNSDRLLIYKRSNVDKIVATVSKHVSNPENLQNQKKINHHRKFNEYLYMYIKLIIFFIREEL